MELVTHYCVLNLKLYDPLTVDHIVIWLLIAIRFCTLQIADFGMARDVADDTYYISTGGKIPVRWTAPEVWILCL